ncbi:MAG: DUF2752 domain-containing protein [Syntrophorhabdaceae bacterium]|nr:DUF2752 domain-containing protein [Syntrophorhabdaceae bacterium]
MEHYLIPRKAALALIALLLAFVFVNTTGIVSAEKLVGTLPVFCPFEALTGIPCPGCGMTRAMLSLIAGNPGDAAAYNPFCFFLLFVVIVSIIPARWLKKAPPGVGRVLPHLYIVALVLVISFWVFDRLLPNLK